MKKALIAHKAGKPLEVVELIDVTNKKGGDDSDDEGYLTVKVLSAGLAFPDLLTIEDKHVMKMKFPFVVGGEMAGIVSKVGKGCGDYKVGDMVFGHCYGGIQTETKILAEQAYRIPRGCDPHLFSGFITNYGTTWHGLVDIANIQKGECLFCF